MNDWTSYTGGDVYCESPRSSVRACQSLMPFSFSGAPCIHEFQEQFIKSSFFIPSRSFPAWLGHLVCVEVKAYHMFLWSHHSRI